MKRLVAKVLRKTANRLDSPLPPPYAPTFTYSTYSASADPTYRVPPFLP